MAVDKQCPKCCLTKPLSEFYKNRATSDGHCTYCKDCERRYKQERVEEDPLYWKRYNVRKFGISLAEFKEMGKDQDFRCAICQQETEDLVIDHDHDIGEVRGLLCRNCNSGLGLFGDEIDNLLSAIQYLRRSR